MSTMTHAAPGIKDHFVPVTSELLEHLDENLRSKVRVGDILSCAEDGRITGFWREM